ncbi:hypothetical protein AMTR_s00051p00176940 [Amborella trichopoda]|uniref:Uncharacterized protein n=1 Tax=Amborella trichopoda TaxID=13333 RepID=U5D8G6_AMBTC|nr:hypothetical protein AMTR_s00051p00176940 [Amborella trichopoda]
MQHTISSLISNPEEGIIGEFIIKRGGTSKTRPPVHTARHSAEASRDKRTPRSTSTRNPITKKVGIESLGLIPKASSTSTINTDGPRGRFKDEQAIAFERLAERVPLMSLVIFDQHSFPKP